MEYFIVFLYLLILGITIFAQFTPLFQETNKYDFLLFINVFKLFSPKPVNIDIRIFYRDLFDNKLQSDLMEFRYYSKPCIKKALWFFGKTEFYTISRCLKVISQMNRQNIGEDIIFKSRFYKKIQFEVLKLNRNDKSTYRQIIFVSHNSFANIKNSNIYLIKNIQLKK